MEIGILHYAAPPVVGGVELTIYHHARVLTELGHTVKIMAGQGEAVLPQVVYQTEPLAGSRDPKISAVTKQLAQGHCPPDFAVLVEQTKAALLDYFGDCEVVVGHNFFTLHKNLVLTTAVYQLTQANEGPAWVAWHHDFAWLRPQYQPELHPGEPWELLKRPWPGVRHVTVSQAQQADLARLYNMPIDSITVVSAGVEPTEFYRCTAQVSQLATQWGLLNAECVFLLPARITRRKNIELSLPWLSAIRALSSWDARLVITGPPGPHNPSNAAYLQQLLTLRDELQLDEAVHFVYQANENANRPLLLTDDDVTSFYQIADAMIFTSRQEGFGIPILEAGLARLPIFATDLPPFRESGADYPHLFALNASPQAVAETVVSVLQQDTAFQLRRRVLREFSWRGIVQSKMIPLLMETIS